MTGTTYPTNSEQANLIAAAQAGDQEAFQQLIEPYRRELLIHCYRFFGSMEDAEDQLQETLLRAWRRLTTYAGRASLRAWLYKIATNACLDVLDRHRARALPSTTDTPADPSDPLPHPMPDLEWLDPLPDSLLSGISTDPSAAYEAHESVTLAFLALLLQLPGRQRAVLILRDVLGFTASEAAQILDVTVVAANSALQRARQTMLVARAKRGERGGAGDGLSDGTSGGPGRRDDLTNERQADLLARYVQAWEAADSAGLVSLLREDAVLTMPPVAAWYRGRQNLGAFVARFLFAEDAAGGGAESAVGRFRLVATRANGAPAFAVYQRDEPGGDARLYRAAAVHVLTLAGDQIAEIHDFLSADGRLFARFGLPVAVEESFFVETRG